MSTTSPLESTIGDPTWEIAELFPRQGHWSEVEYLLLQTNRLIELSNGKLEVLPMPTQSHQFIVLALYRLFYHFISERKLGVVAVAPLRVKLWDGTIREPDIVFMRTEHQSRRSDEYWLGADLAVEVVSTSDPKRDLEIKLGEYAAAGIPEYWIVDPRHASITIWKLATAGQPYAEVGAYKPGEFAASVLLDGLTIDVDEIFAAARD